MSFLLFEGRSALSSFDGSSALPAPGPFLLPSITETFHKALRVEATPGGPVISRFPFSVRLFFGLLLSVCLFLRFLSFSVPVSRSIILNSHVTNPYAEPVRAE